MTKINKIVMHGFKSFAKRTEILFEDRFNCVLGPNGSGKSNVLDALCFVLGKSSAKGLRAEKSSNLIYNGGKSKKGAKEGEVSIYFDNSKKIFPVEGETVKITRIITQSGQSKYRINDRAHTRQQIVDLLAAVKIDPDGYNIILQGDIVRFVEMSTAERRQIIEEISGIGVYEEKKQKAVRELEKVEGKLNEAEIILKERKTYLDELKKDRDQALKYKNLSDKISQNKASYLKIQITRKEEGVGKLQKQHDDNKSSFEKKQAQVGEGKAKINSCRKEISELNREVEEKGEKEQIQLQKEIEEIRVDIATKKTRISSIDNELDRIKQREDQLSQNLGDIGNKTKDLTQKKNDLINTKSRSEKDLKIIAEKLSAFKKKHKIDEDKSDVEQRIETIDKEAEDLQKNIQKLREEQQELLRQKDKTEFQLESIEQQIEKVREIEKEHKKELDELKAKREEFSRIVTRLNNELEASSELAGRIKELEIKLFSSKEHMEKLRLQQTRVSERKAGSLAVKKILENKSQFGAVFGTVSELGKVKSKYSLALEVAAGSRINNIVVETDAIAAKCIKYLRSNKLGIATMLPLNKLKAPHLNENVLHLRKEAGVHGLASELIKFDSKFKIVFSYVFGNTLVVDDLSTARRLGIGFARMVTLQGDLVEMSGAMQGGFRQQRGGTFQEADVSDDISKLESEIGEMQSRIKSLVEEQHDNEAVIVKLREERASLEGDIIKTEKSLHVGSGDLDASRQNKDSLEKDITGFTKKINEVGADITSKNRQLTDMKIEKQKLREKVNQLRSPTLLAELTAFEQKQSELTEQVREIDGELRAIEMQEREIFGRDKENITKIMKDLEKEIIKFKEEKETLVSQLKEDSIKLKEQEAMQAKYYVKFKELYAKRNKLNDEITKHEKIIDELLDKSRKDEYAMNTASLELARIKAELAGLKEEFLQYEGVPLNLKKSESELKSEIREFEKIKENIGSVNMRALEIYEAVEKEYNTLTDKREKLMKEKEDVLGMMGEIEDKKIDLFMKNYNTMNEHFKEIFTKLSAKGEAYLELENPENPFEAGVQIKVKLSGNKFMDIRSLSGGEKTLTALAFIFSIQEYEPASFYVLDEVDAALDKHNSQKLAKLVAQYADKAQYLMISHNDSVISEADALFGVSMNEHGISTVTSLKV